MKKNVLFILFNLFTIMVMAQTKGRWKSHATLTLLAKQDCPLWLQYD